jgi:hypothetical protein
VRQRNAFQVLRVFEGAEVVGHVPRQLGDALVGWLGPHAPDAEIRAEVQPDRLTPVFHRQWWAPPFVYRSLMPTRRTWWWRGRAGTGAGRTTPRFAFAAR